MTQPRNAYQRAEELLYEALHSFAPPHHSHHHHETRLYRLALNKLHSHGLKDVALLASTIVPVREGEDVAKQRLCFILTTVCPNWETRLDNDLADGR